jgi:hypothetical protein
MSDPERDYVISQIGQDARPTGRMRLATCQGQARFQQKWIGELGYLWLDVPMVEVPYLPPHVMKLKAPLWAVDANEVAP